MHPLRAQRVDRHRRAQSRIDAARQAEHDAGKAVVLDIVAQAHDAGRIVRFVALLDHLARTLDAAPARVAPLPDRARHHRAEGGQLRAEAAVGVERERAAVEHELVLSADHVEIDERQAALDDARHGDVLANGELVALVRRGVGDEQNFAARFEDAFDRVGTPDVLADRNADAHAAKHDRPRRRARREHALLVEDAVIGQIDLEPHRLDPPAIEQRHGVIELAVLDPGQADQRRRPAVGGVARELLAGRPAGLLERRLQHQILGRIAGEIELRRHHDVGPEGRGLLARFAQPVAVARDVADDRRDLGERDDEAVGRGGHGRDFSAGRRGSGGAEMVEDQRRVVAQGPASRKCWSSLTAS